jgi:hypothetical protein
MPVPGCVRTPAARLKASYDLEVATVTMYVDQRFVVVL